MSMSRDFQRVSAEGGRASIPPERLVRALTLQILHSIRSERLLCEQLEYNLLFRWFVGLSIDEAVWDHSTFTKNRERLIEAKVARKLLRRVVRNAKAARLLSNEHFSVDGTLIESWAAVKSMRRRDGKDEPPGPGRNAMVDFHGERRTNETHVSPIDPEAKPARKGKGQRIRKRIEEGFGWGKDGRPLRKMKVTGKAQVGFMATLTIICYALLRVANLLRPPLMAPA